MNQSFSLHSHASAIANGGLHEVYAGHRTHLITLSLWITLSQASIAAAISAPCSTELQNNWADVCELQPFLDEELLAFIQAVAVATV